MFRGLFFFFFTFPSMAIMNEELNLRKENFEREIINNYGAITIRNVNKPLKIILYILYKKNHNNEVIYTILTVTDNYEKIISRKYKEEQNIRILSKYRPKIIYSTPLSSMNVDYLKRKFSSKLRFNHSIMMDMVAGFTSPHILEIFAHMMENNVYMDDLW